MNDLYGIFKMEHPGKKVFLAMLKDFAKKVDIDPRALDSLIDGEIDINDFIARKLSEAGFLTYEYWIDEQIQYEKARKICNASYPKEKA